MSIADTFGKAKAEGRSVLVGCMPAGFPTVPGSIAAMRAMVESGVDVVEVEFPYSDPVMDGPVIQRASEIALAGGVRTRDVLHAIEATGYGLTLGIHSRIDDTVEAITDAVAVGNIYVNRNMIGAVVGVQPFGGHGLSGTGPKAGGPHYLPRFATEQTVTINTAAAGGNAALMSGEE